MVATSATSVLVPMSSAIGVHWSWKCDCPDAFATMERSGLKSRSPSLSRQISIDATLGPNGP